MRMQKRFRDGESRLIPIRDVFLNVRVFGQGKPIVLMHGGLGIDHTVMLSLLPLARTHTLIFYDHRCNGRSRGSSVASMTWENLTADADTLREYFGYEQWTVLGHSFGGMIALEYALRYPDRLSHLIVADTCANADWVQHYASAELARRGYPQYAVNGAHRFFNGRMKPAEVPFLLMMFGRAYTYRFNVFHFLPLLRIRANPTAVIFGFANLLRGWNVLNKLDTIQISTLIIAGRADFQFPPAHQMEIVSLLPKARLEIIERAGHNAPQEQPARVCQIITKFLSM